MVARGVAVAVALMPILDNMLTIRGAVSFDSLVYEERADSL